MADNVLISAGDVIEVQLTSETVVMQTAQGRRVLDGPPGEIKNRMRLFVRELEGGEQKYDFDDTELGVRETQRVAIVRAKLKRIPDPVNLILFNLSSGENDTFEQGLQAHLGRTPFFGAVWKAVAISFGVGVVFWCVSHFLMNRGAVMAGFLAAMFAFLLFPLMWWVCGTWDRVSERMRYKNARKRFIAEMTARVSAYAPTQR